MKSFLVFWEILLKVCFYDEGEESKNKKRRSTRHCLSLHFWINNVIILLSGYLVQETDDKVIKVRIFVKRDVFWCHLYPSQIAQRGVRLDERLIQFTALSGMKDIITIEKRCFQSTDYHYYQVICNCYSLWCDLLCLFVFLFNKKKIKKKGEIHSGYDSKGGWLVGLLFWEMMMRKS